MKGVIKGREKVIRVMEDGWMDKIKGRASAKVLQ